MRRRDPRDALVLLLPALLFGALHLPALDYGLVWTDLPEITQGSILRPPGHILHAFAEPLQGVSSFETSSFSQPYYRPIQVVTASLLAAHLGRAPRVFRSVNLLLGAATAVLFTALAWTLLGTRSAALFAGALWAAHPVGLEIYVWVGGLSAAWVGLFVVASVWSAALALCAERGPARARYEALSLAALALGLLSKENAAVVPGLTLALLLGLAATREPPRPWRRAAALVAAQAALVLAYVFALRPAVLGTALNGAPPIGGRLTTQWLTSLASWPASLGWLWLPLHSTTSDAVRVVSTPSDPGALTGALLGIGSAVLFLVWLRRGRGVAAFALAWIWIGFLPTSGLAPLLHARAERNLFLSAFGVALLVPCAGPWLRGRVPPLLLSALAVACVLGLAERTLQRQPDWRSTQTLFEHDVARDPRHREGRLNLVAAYVRKGDLAAAKREVDVLVRQRRPRGWTSYALDASLLEAACLVNGAVGRDADTLAMVEAAPPAGGPAQMPGFHECFAAALERLGRPARALPIYEALYRRAPPDVAARYALGAARCQAALGARDPALGWLARIEPSRLRDPEIARQAAALRTQLGPPRP